MDHILDTIKKGEKKLKRMAAAVVVLVNVLQLVVVTGACNDKVHIACQLHSPLNSRYIMAVEEHVGILEEPHSVISALHC